ncbi:2-oxoglutarate (2OG) and Fe(II)-dependent oxygenase superfamily protein [Rhynchospora pubera]|uniref:2-oxoglutarate (2OG) and Fe(II)-dependent oxygenase superfamily protein n=1 Tax=Rhynchospora pubera TaxID=906938 RepID=A0AAV8GCV5_9POAL|nr:2-oxoglutarate (2OG) and Fe(II)-dependent oxygenase superfamily protein [Rhynchospora pubera]
MNCEDKNTIPTVDLSPFFNEDEFGRKLATDTIAEACQTYGFFRIINHGIPPQLLSQALDLSKQFFALPDVDKQKVKPMEGSKGLLPAGYARQPEHSKDKNEYFLVFVPDFGLNVYPDQPTEFKRIIEDCYTRLEEVASLIQEIINNFMGLPPDFLKEYNQSRNMEFMTAHRYFPATETENNGLSAHEDSNCLTLIFQDEVGGLEVLKDADWIPIEPIEGSIIVNLGDIIQVLSNNKFKSATHRVLRKATHRHSFSFFFNLDGEKWIEPLPQFTTDIGESPKYKGFHYEEYIQLRVRNKTHPPSRPEDVIHVTHYSI